MKSVALSLMAAAFLVACTRAEEAPPEEASAPAPAAAPAPPAAPAVTADGPEAIVAPLATISTAAADVEKGKELFGSKGCGACHKIGGGKLVGPDLKGVTERRSLKWTQRMILRPDLMIQQDPAAKELFKTYMLPMPNQGVDPATELPALMAYLKANEK
ncbi:MAG: cytochrome c [Myxococcota bacterium]